MKPFKLYPAFQDYLWGGTNLKPVYPDCTMSPLAEAWVLSCHDAGNSTIIGNNETLANWIDKNPDAVGTKGKKFPFFPILVKLIDAEQSLSVQVHPDDTYAMEVEKSFGKTEMWYVLDCKPSAKLYYGFTHEITRDEMKERIENNTLTDVLQAVPVKKGDVFFIPAGTIHAIGEGMLIAEIQQNSNTTYRVYDYGRVGADGKTRELHIDKALAVTELKPAANQADLPENMLADCKYFKVSRHKDILKATADADTFHCLLMVEGSGRLTYGDQTMDLNLYDCVFIPAKMGDYSVTGKCEVLDIRV